MHTATASRRAERRPSSHPGKPAGTIASGNHEFGASWSGDRGEPWRSGRGAGASWTMISERLERLVEEMVEKGVQFEDAVQEFEKRFITRVLGRCEGSLTRTADELGIHRNTLTRKMGEYKIKRR
jgi:DNA-binding NtrC family response regulator